MGSEIAIEGVSEVITLNEETDGKVEDDRLSEKSDATEKCDEYYSPESPPQEDGVVISEDNADSTKKESPPKESPVGKSQSQGNGNGSSSGEEIDTSSLTSSSKETSKQTSQTEAPVKVVPNGKPQSQSQRSGFQPPPAVIKLANRSGKLSTEDVRCPICWSILIEPTTLPCNHSLCLTCYMKHVDETSLFCPCCRRRLSVWSRKAKKHEELLDEELWERIKLEFPESVEAKLNGASSPIASSGDDVEEGVPQPQIVRDGIFDTEPGEIFKELQELMVPHVVDIENQRLEEEQASSEYIQKLQIDGIIERLSDDLRRQSDQIHDDYLLALKLQEEFDKKRKLPSSERIGGEKPVKRVCSRNLMEEFDNCASPPPSTKATIPEIQQHNSPNVPTPTVDKSELITSPVKTTSNEPTPASQQKIKPKKKASFQKPSSNAVFTEPLQDSKSQTATTPTITSGDDLSINETNAGIQSKSKKPKKKANFQKPSSSTIEEPLPKKEKKSKSKAPATVTSSEIADAATDITPNETTNNQKKSKPKKKSNFQKPTSTSTPIKKKSTPKKRQPKKSKKLEVASEIAGASTNTTSESDTVATGNGLDFKNVAGTAESSGAENTENSGNAKVSIKKKYKTDKPKEKPRSKKSSSCWCNKSFDSEASDDEVSSLSATSQEETKPTDDNPKLGGFPLPYSPFAVKLRLHTSDYFPDSAEKQQKPKESSDEIIPPADNENDGGDEGPELILGSQEYMYLEKEARTLEMLRKDIEAEEADRAFAERLQQCFDMGIAEPRMKNSENEYSLRSWRRK